MKRITIYTSEKHYARLKQRSQKRGLSISSFVAKALDEAFERESLMEYDWTDEGVEEFLYAEEAQKILDFMKKQSRLPISKENLATMRHDIGIEDFDVFKAAFYELVNNKLIIKEMKNKYGKNIEAYNTKQSREEKRKLKEAKEYAKFQKLKDKFEGKGVENE